jgi:hypothetical protein
MKHITNFFFVFLFCFTLVACTPAVQEQLSLVTTTPPSDTAKGTTIEPSLVNNSNYYLENSMQDLMKFVIDPNVKNIWGAVSYVVTAEGTEETLPTTDADWAGLRSSALTLLEVGNTLMISGRKVGAENTSGTLSEFQLTTEEIAQLIRSEPELWISNVQNFQATVADTLSAIANKDIFAYGETGASINNACDQCHADFWYRQPTNRPQP